MLPPPVAAAYCPTLVITHIPTCWQGVYADVLEREEVYGVVRACRTGIWKKLRGVMVRRVHIGVISRVYRIIGSRRVEIEGILVSFFA